MNLQYNTLDATLPEYNSMIKNAMRNASIGFAAATAAATASNWLRVIKTQKQTDEHTRSATYPQVCVSRSAPTLRFDADCNVAMQGRAVPP